MKVHLREINPDDYLKCLVLAQSTVEAIGIVKVSNPVRSIKTKSDGGYGTIHEKD